MGLSGGNPDPFVGRLVGRKPAIGEQICNAIAADPDDVLRDVLAVVLIQLAEHDPPRAIQLAKDLLARGSTEVARQVAKAFGWNRGTRSGLAPGEIELLRRFASHDDAYVRQAAVRAAQLIARQHRAEAVDLVTRVPFHDSTEVARYVFSSFGSEGDLSFEELSSAQADAMIEQLCRCPSIEDYQIMEFLSQLSKNDPNLVWRLLRQRVERHELADPIDKNFRPLPFHWYSALQARSHPRFEALLSEIVHWIAAEPESWQRRKMGGEIFRAFAGQFDEPVIAVLDAAIRVDARALLEAVAAVLSEAPRGLVWEGVDFVCRVLAAAARHGDDCVRRVRGSLYAIVSGDRTGTLGAPFPEDIEQRDRAAEIVEKLPRGSTEERFYRSLVRSAEKNMRWDAEDDEKLLDGRDW